MSHYQLRVLSSGDHISQILGCEARDDLQALERAQELCAGAAVEVWHHDRRVARVKQNDAPAQPGDPVSG